MTLMYFENNYIDLIKNLNKYTVVFSVVLQILLIFGGEILNFMTSDHVSYSEFFHWSKNAPNAIMHFLNQ